MRAEDSDKDDPAEAVEAVEADELTDTERLLSQSVARSVKLPALTVFD